MRATIWFVVVCLTVSICIGCGGQGERGKFKDRDRPKSADKEK